jgi:hypothetical protein
MAYDSNLDAVAEAIRKKIADFGFNSSSSRGGGTVGDRAAKTVAQGIHDRSIRFEGPDGRWPDNADSTVERKGFNAPNFETGGMLSEEQIAGEVTVTPNECAIRYGKDEENREKAGYAHGGQGRGKVVRRFFALDEQISRAVVEVVREELGDHLSKD